MLDGDLKLCHTDAVSITNLRSTTTHQLACVAAVFWGEEQVEIKQLSNMAAILDARAKEGLGRSCSFPIKNSRYAGYTSVSKRKSISIGNRTFTSSIWN